MKTHTFTEKLFKHRETNTTCDLCGEHDRWLSGWYDSGTEISATFGDIFPEQNCQVVVGIDCCVSCFLGRIKPAIEALGLKSPFHMRDFDDPERDYAEPCPLGAMTEEDLYK